MRKTIALEIIVEVGMSVEMKDGEIVIFCGDRSHNWIGDGVISAQHERGRARFKQAANGLLHGFQPTGLIGESDVSCVMHERKNVAAIF